MINLIIESYFSILLGIAASALLFLLAGVLLLYRQLQVPAKRQVVIDAIDTFTKSQKSVTTDSAFDIDFNTIAGEDVYATQLDLARAFIETGNKMQAEKILNVVSMKGSLKQQQEAQQLKNYL